MTGRETLVVFSDDWGRHPSSCQHLVRELLPRYDVIWVDTIGTRPIRFDLYTLRRGLGKVAGWLRPKSAGRHTDAPRPRIVQPLMWPSYRTRFARGLNRRLVARRLNQELSGRRVTILTTIPVVADLIGAIPASRWVYYCVDDFSVWPGLDGATMASIEAELVAKADCVVAAGEHLRQRLSGLGREAALLTHGVDLEFWNDGVRRSSPLDALEQPVVLFWGLIDPRLNVEWVARLSDSMTAGSIALVGPIQDADPRLAVLPRVRMLGPTPFEQLPSLAQSADVLVMPYAALPVTRAMQPLKFKEYLATGKPTVAARLPALEEWSDAADLVDSGDAFVAAVLNRLAVGADAAQLKARERLKAESWAAKAQELERIWREGSP